MGSCDKLSHNFMGQGVLNQQDDVYQQERAARTRKVRGRDVPRNTNLHLFHGPPGTGKTFAMKVIAAEAGASLKAFTLNLGEPGYGTLKNMQDALKSIDECLSFNVKQYNITVFFFARVARYQLTARVLIFFSRSTKDVIWPQWGCSGRLH